jgi:hypothetical protein
MAGRWVDVTEASRELGISTDAVRKRIARGSLENALLVVGQGLRTSSRMNGRLVWAPGARGAGGATGYRKSCMISLVRAAAGSLVWWRLPEGGKA